MFLRSAAAAILLGCCLLSATAWADDCKLKQFAAVSARFTKNGRILLDLSIDGEPAKMILDTGGAVSTLEEAYVDRRKLPAVDSGRKIVGMTGTQLYRATRVSELTLGNAVAHDVVFQVTSLLRNGGNGGPVGLFGADFLVPHEVELDPEAGRVTLFSPDHCPGNVVYWAKEYFRVPFDMTPDGRIEVAVTIDGKVFHGLVDTGAPMTTMRLAVAQAAFNITPESVDEQSRGYTNGVDGVKISAFAHNFQSLTFGGITLQNTKVVIADIDSGQGATHAGSRITGNSKQPDLLIGMSLLSRLHMFISYSERALYFTLADHSPAVAP
jgi:predicted aspartyl protease